MSHRNDSRNLGELHVLGLGLDGTDGHTRLTRGEGFTVAGGSEETHGHMAEALIRTQEALARHGETIRTADPKRVRDLLSEHDGRGFDE